MLVKNEIITGNNLNGKEIFWLKILIFWLSFFPTSILFLLFFNLFSLWIPSIIIICFLPILMILYYGMFILYLLFFTKLVIIFLNLVKTPREGIFQTNNRDKDFKFYLLRRNLKNFILNIYNYFPLPWAKIFALKILDIKIQNNTGLLDSYIDSDFVEIGNNVILGEGSIILSSMIIGDTLLVKRVILKDGCTIGAFSVISPGTFVEEGAILGMGSYTKVNQHLDKNSINIGRPAKKIQTISNTTK